ncbi:unnamed protein product [Ambrosiozyma monospora]|uniref:Unnamed protein product n=1 Tax=Ambrosiozyma monospora TaxID=43982 RepID=A0ACB5T7G6_AMBMO|nr:unnamed protein product [Ambrosiozyma monospora]
MSTYSQFATSRHMDGRLTPANDLARSITGLLKSPPPQSHDKPTTTSNGKSVEHALAEGHSRAIIEALFGKKDHREPSSTTTKSSNSSADIPSPPLSPYTKNATLQESTQKYPSLFSSEENNSKADSQSLTSTATRQSISSSESSQLQTKSTTSTTTKADESNNVKNEKKRPFPIEDMKDSSLFLDPFSDLKNPGYKKRQLNFLSQYQLISTKPSNTVSYARTRLHAHSTRSAMNSTFSTVAKPRYYGSDTDSSSSHNHNSHTPSSMERPRTRRVVKETSVPLESDDNNASAVVSRPSTPRKRKPVKRVDPLAYNFAPMS